MSELTQHEKPATKAAAKIVYILYLVSILFGLLSLVGVIVVYVNKGDAPEWLKTHYQFQIRTFWIGLLYSLVCGILIFVIIGYFLFIFVIIWLIVRCAKGLKALDKEEAIANPKSWLF